MEWIPAALLLIALLVALAGTGGRRAEAERQSRRIADVERKLDLILDHLGIHEPTPDAPVGVLEELVAGRKIQAIKRYREATGVGLKEAKDAVEAIARLRGLE